MSAALLIGSVALGLPCFAILALYVLDALTAWMHKRRATRRSLWY